MHSNALQHLTGKTDVAWQTYGEAARAARTMRLYREEQIKCGDEVDSTLLRQLFLHLYASDKAAEILASRPVLLNGILFEEQMTLKSTPPSSVPLASPGRQGCNQTTEERLQVGANMVHQLLSAAALIILEIRGLKRIMSADEDSQFERALKKRRLTKQFLGCNSIYYQFPAWLDELDKSTAAVDDEDFYAKTSFGIQKSAILIQYHSQRILITQECIYNDLAEAIGLSNNPLTLAVRKGGLIRDWIAVLTEVPLVYFKVLAESCVELIRRVGSIILQSIDAPETESVAMQTRMESYLKKLVDTLARLDSRASDTLTSMYDS